MRGINIFKAIFIKTFNFNKFVIGFILFSIIYFTCLDPVSIWKKLEAENLKNEKAQYENYRRIIEYTITELRLLLKSENLELFEKHPQIANYYRSVMLGHTNDILNNLHNLAQTDGLNTWRSQESKYLTNLVQKRLNYIQNPSKCTSTKKLVCSLNKGCNLACQMHELVLCLSIAYGTKRTLLLFPDSLNPYEKLWTTLIKPLSSCRLNYQEMQKSSGDEPNSQFLFIDSELSNADKAMYAQFIPPAIPEDLASRIIAIHGNPMVWWISQLVDYIYRLVPDGLRALDHITLKFQNPIVGLHVRRQNSNSVFRLEKYMEIVDDYFDLLEQRESTELQRRVFIASDDPTVIHTAKINYPSYLVLDSNSTESIQSENVTFKFIYGFMNDLYFLSHSDFLVCTFSSNFCRLAYELMQKQFMDGSNKARSLDEKYFFTFREDLVEVARLDHEAEGYADEITFKKGDKIKLEYNLWNSFSKGVNLDHYEAGLFPSYKTSNEIVTFKGPRYSEIKTNVP